MTIRWNRKIAVAFAAMLCALGATSIARAAPEYEVFATAGSAGNFYLAHSDAQGNYLPTPPANGYFAALPSTSFGLTFGADHKFYVGTYNGGQVLKIDPVTAATSTFVGAGVGGLTNPVYVNFGGPNGDLYVSIDNGQRILRYTSAGAPDPSGSNPGATFTTAIAGIQPVGFDLSPDGTKLVAGYEGSSGFVKVHDAVTGAEIQSIALSQNAWDVVALTNDVYLVSTADRILSVTLSTSTVTTLINPGQGGLVTPRGLEIGPDGLLYVADSNALRVLRYDPFTGANMPNLAYAPNAYHTQPYNGSLASGFDSIQDVALFVPEPASASLIIFVAALVARRSRRLQVC